VHTASYPRKPRGVPQDLLDDYDRRLSFSCAAEGCRKRKTPPSVRFLGRRVYVSVVIVLVTTMLHGATRDRVRRLAKELEASPETIERWRAWWREIFPSTPFWRAARGRFAPSVEVSRLPKSLVERFGASPRTRVERVLRFLMPLTTTSASVASRSSSMGA
jgi:hypothetical protein